MKGDMTEVGHEVLNDLVKAVQAVGARHEIPVRVLIVVLHHLAEHMAKVAGVDMGRAHVIEVHDDP